MRHMRAYIWIKIYCPIWSFIVNLTYWLIRLNKLKSIFYEKENLKNSIKTVDDIKRSLSEFQWTSDKIRDWFPWVITLINNNYKDDCDGAAILSKFLFEQIGIIGKILSLLGEETGHAIFISTDKKYMATNNIIIEGNWTNDKILSYFNDKYNRIIK